MKKGKRMNKIILIITSLAVVAVVGTVVFIRIRPKQVARTEIARDIMPINVEAAEMEKKLTAVEIPEMEKMPIDVEAPEMEKTPNGVETPKREKMPVSEKTEDAAIGEMEKTMGKQEYVENQVVAVAESKREAKKIAKQIGGELISYDNQVAVIQIGVTVEEMMQQLEEDSSLPKVYPNYQGYQNNTN